MDHIINTLEQASRIVSPTYPLTSCEIAEAARLLRRMRNDDEANREALAAHWR